MKLKKNVCYRIVIEVDVLIGLRQVAGFVAVGLIVSLKRIKVFK